VFLQPTGNPDIVVVAMEWSARSLGWSRTGTTYLWAVNKNAPNTPLSVDQAGNVTSASTQTTSAPAGNGDTPNVNDDDNKNGWEDGRDVEWADYTSGLPDGHVTIGPLIILSSDSYFDTDNYFNGDNAKLENISYEVEF
jgi:hypothetical protein